jgi:NhaA family Na+:H+ antiporter
LILVLGAVPIGLALRRRRVGSFWWYLLLPGVISWSGFALSGLHPALGLLPVIPTLPHAHTGQEHAHGRVSSRNDALNQLESWWKNPVQVILGVFGLLNAGVPFTALGATTFLILLGLLVGKPVGIFLTGLLATRAFGLWLPEGISWRTLFVIGCAAGIGFTVALFITTVAFGPGPIQDASKMGALASGVAALVAIAAGRLLRIEKTPSQTQAG